MNHQFRVRSVLILTLGATGNYRTSGPPLTLLSSEDSSRQKELIASGQSPCMAAVIMSHEGNSIRTLSARPSGIDKLLRAIDRIDSLIERMRAELVASGQSARMAEMIARKEERTKRGG